MVKRPPEILFGSLLLTVLLIVAITNIGEIRQRSVVSNARRDLQATREALISYYDEHQAWPESLGQLTTPVAFMIATFPDPFAGEGTFSYHHDENGFILWSPGPDRDIDLTRPELVYTSKIPQPTPLLLVRFTYDPTNGILSNGDIWRVR